MSLTDYLAGATLYASAPIDNKVLIFTTEWSSVPVEQPRGIVTEPSGKWSVVTIGGIDTYQDERLVRTLHTGIYAGHEAIATAGGFYVTDPQRSAVSRASVDGSVIQTHRLSGVDQSEDNRTHINGVATNTSGPHYVTALGVSNTTQGWREEAAAGRGVVIDVTTGQNAVEDLLFPHSPRVHDGDLWVLDSGHGVVRHKNGHENFAVVHGFARGLAFHNGHVFVGVSQARPSAVDAITTDPLAEPGIVVLDESGAQVHFEPLDVREIFDIQIGA